jgi:assimilatory nitrate reductase catalytic subunit
VVCACFGVSESCIRDAVASGRAGNVTEIGQATRAGTNCGSCLPELKRMIAQERARAKEAAE